jgi:uncharacterized protein (DUF924 family)
LAAAQRRWAAELLHFWFHTLRPADWFRTSPSVDDELRRPASDFLGDPLTARAAVLLFDQVPRNIHRQSPKAFASDALARAIMREALRRGWDRGLSLAERQFLVLPLMHSEAIADQRLSLAVFAPLGRRHGFPFARSHYRMIARFGRFPHRNAVLGRRSTAAEQGAVAEGFSW